MANEEVNNAGIIVAGEVLLAAIITIILLVIRVIKLNGFAFVVWLGIFGIIFFAWVILTKDISAALSDKIDQKNVDKIGWTASVMAILMYVSYIDQIRLNLSGHQGSVILPIVTIINCSFWVIYGLLLEKRSWPIIACNIPGILLGAITAITAII